MRIEGLANLTPEGSGGFSQVFRATETRFDRTVAAKVLNFRLDEADDRERFERECQAMAQLSDHPNIVPLYSTTYTDEGYPVIIMEFFAGGTLWARARKGASVAELLDSGVKIASALQTAHDRGVTHRDVKPQNVLMSRFNEPGLTDFGISAFDKHKTGQGRPRGITIAYASPEALDGVSSPRTDVYSLAATLYTVLADQRPFDAPGQKQSTGELIRRILSEDPPPLQQFGLSPAIDHVIRRVGLARNPSDRPATAADFGELLRGVQRTEGFEATPWTEAHDMTDMSLPTMLGDESQAVIHQPEPVTHHEPVDLEREPQHGRSRRRLIAGVAGMLALVLIVLAAVISSGRDTGSSGEDPILTPAPIATADDFYATAPLPPADVTVVAGDGGALLTWRNPNENDVTFEVQQKLDGRPVGDIVTSTETSITIPAVAPDACFVLWAVSADNQLSLETPETCLRP